MSVIQIHALNIAIALLEVLLRRNAVNIKTAGINNKTKIKK